MLSIGPVRRCQPTNVVEGLIELTNRGERRQGAKSSKGLPRAVMMAR